MKKQLATTLVSIAVLATLVSAKERAPITVKKVQFDRT